MLIRILSLGNLSRCWGSMLGSMLISEFFGPLCLFCLAARISHVVLDCMLILVKLAISESESGVFQCYMGCDQLEDSRVSFRSSIDSKYVKSISKTCTVPKANRVHSHI